jgi:hypothetical protein
VKPARLLLVKRFGVGEDTLVCTLRLTTAPGARRPACDCAWSPADGPRTPTEWRQFAAVRDAAIASIERASARSSRRRT